MVTNVITSPFKSVHNSVSFIYIFIAVQSLNNKILYENKTHTCFFYSHWEEMSKHVDPGAIVWNRVNISQVKSVRAKGCFSSLASCKLSLILILSMKSDPILIIWPRFSDGGKLLANFQDMSFTRHTGNGIKYQLVTQTVS